MPKHGQLVQLWRQRGRQRHNQYRDQCTAHGNFILPAEAVGTHFRSANCRTLKIQLTQLDQSTEYVVGYGDVPLGVGQFKGGFIAAAKYTAIFGDTYATKCSSTKFSPSTISFVSSTNLRNASTSCFRHENSKITSTKKCQQKCQQTSSGEG